MLYKKMGIRIVSMFLVACVLGMLLCPMNANATDNTEAYTQTFGYTQMKNNEEKTFYANLYNAVCNLERSVILPENNNFTFDRLQDISFLIANDLPEAFYYRGSLELVRNSGGTFVQVNPIYSIDGTLVYTDPNNPDNATNFAKIIERKAEVERKLNEIVSAMPTDCNTDTEKSKYIHDYLVNTITYKETQNDQTIYGALIQGKCVCSGYAAAFAALCHRVGVKCWVIEGEGGPSAGQMTPHAWNVAWIDGNCLYTDVTWDDQSKVTYRYFNINGNTFNKDHTPREDYAKTLGSCNHQSSAHSLSETTTVTLDKTNAILYSRGETFALHATVTSDANVKKTLQWTTSDNTIAIVDNNGVVTAVGGGKATITVTHMESGKTAKCIVTVNVAKPHEHKIEPVSGKDATCTESGIKDYFKCTSCGLRFHDEAGTNEVIQDSELEIKAIGHTEGEWGFNNEKHWKICSTCNTPIEKTMRDHQIREGACGTCGYDTSMPTEPTPTEPVETTPTTAPTQPTTQVTDPTDNTTIPSEPAETRPNTSAEEKPENSKAVIIFGIILCAGMAAAAIYMAVKPGRK